MKTSPIFNSCNLCLIAGSGIVFTKNNNMIIVSSTNCGASEFLLYNGTFNYNITTDQPIDLSSWGNTFAKLNILLDNPNANNSTARNFQIWTGPNKTGVQLYTSKIGGIDGLQTLNMGCWIDFSSGDIVYGSGMQSSKIEIPNLLYASLSTSQGGNVSSRIIITGIILT